MTPVLTRHRPRTVPKCRGLRIRPGRQHCRYGVAPRNFFGAFAASLSGSPPPTAPAFVSRTTGGVTTGTSMSISRPSGINAGDFVLIIVGGSRTNAAPTFSCGGYTKMVEIFQASGTSGGFLVIYGLLITGASFDPTFSVGTGNTSMTYICEKWTGVASFSSALTGNGYITGGTFTMTSNTVTPTVDNSVVVTGIGGRAGASGDVSHVWGGGATGAYDTASGRLGFCNDANETVASASARTHTAQVTNAQGNPASCIGSVILSPV